MYKNKWKILLRLIFAGFIFSFLFPIYKSYSLTPLSGVLMGEVSLEDGTGDPLQYVFSLADKATENGPENQKFLQVLEQYISFYYEGENLQGQCKRSSPIVYSTPWHHEQAKRSVVATLQTIGLDLSTRAVAEYAKQLHFSKEEYQNLANRLTGQYCSKNLSIISLKALNHNLMYKFQHSSEYRIPSTKNNPYFSRLLVPWSDSNQALEQGLLYTVKLFRAFCSWGGDVHNYRLMAPLLRNPYIMSFISRQMAHKKIQSDSGSLHQHRYSLVESKDTVRASCQQFICRQSSDADFFKNFPLAVGSQGIDQDVQRLYCQEFRTADYGVIQSQEKHVKEWIDKQTFDEENLMVAHFYSLITGIPDFFIGSNKFKEAITFMRSPIDQTWAQWAVLANKNYSADLFYEESLTVEKVPRSYYFFYTRPKFKVVFDVNLGEIDRSVFMIGKISATFHLKIIGSVLSYVRSELLTTSPQNKIKMKSIKELLKSQIEKQVDKEKTLFAVPPWEGDLAEIITNELTEQLKQYQGNYFENVKHDKIDIPIEFRYAPFALKYLRYRFRSQRGLPEIDI